MAYHFNCGQYNDAYKPERLGNWEVPRWAPSKPRPACQRPPCHPIADIHGNMFPGVPRGTSGPFGHHVGTWDMPRRITREVAEELTREPPNGRFIRWLHPRKQRNVPKRGLAVPVPSTCSGESEETGGGEENGGEGEGSEHKFVDETGEKVDKSEIQNKDERRNTDKSKSQDNKEATNDVFAWNDVKGPVDKEGNGPYVPGSNTEAWQRHDSYDLLVKDATEKLHGPQEDNQDKFWRKVAENANYKQKESEEEDKSGSNDTMRDHHPRNKIQRQDPPTKLPDVNTNTGYHHARKLHMENLEHQPLPDTLAYRYLAQVGQQRDSDIEVKPYAIAWKGYGASGPTCCTKMRIHRPKTCDAKPANKENVERPSTTVTKFEKPMTRMDLAICWDYRPQNPCEEPKPPKHIDGSNGSKAPAVFTMIHTPKQDELKDIPAHTNPIFNQNFASNDAETHKLPYFEKDMSKMKRKDSCEVQYCPHHNNSAHNPEHRHNSRKESKSTHSAGTQSSQKSNKCDGIKGCGTPSVPSSAGTRECVQTKRFTSIKNAWTDTNEREKKILSDKDKNIENSIQSYDKTSLAQGKLHQSSRNVSDSSETSKDNNNNMRPRNCVSCKDKKLPEQRPKTDYKFAFKAGNPNSQGSNNGSTDSKNVKIPKMRQPYSKKSYNIPTLAPPFCIWRNASNSGYPEHWRLASVYQRTYKPIDQRRKTPTNSVFQ